MSTVPTVDELKAEVDWRLNEIASSVIRPGIRWTDDGAESVRNSTIHRIKAEVLPLVYMATVLEAIGLYSSLGIGLVDEVASQHQQFKLLHGFTVDTDFEEQPLPDELVPQPKGCARGACEEPCGLGDCGQ